MNEIWAIFMGGVLLIPMPFLENRQILGGINKGQILNEIGYKKFFEAKIYEGELIVPMSF